MSLVVSGQVAQVNHNSCLIIDFRSHRVQSPTSTSKKKNIGHNKTINSLLNYAGIPLEISYVKSDKQFDSFDNFLAFLQPKEQVFIENFTEEQQTQEVVLEQKVEAIQIISEPINDQSVKMALEAKDENAYEEKPVLRMPSY